jgi:hypothetical protein
MGTLREDLYTFFIVSGSFILKMRNVSDKICRGNQYTHFIFNNPPNAVPCMRKLKIGVEPDKPQMAL